MAYQPPSAFGDEAFLPADLEEIRAAGGILFWNPAAFDRCVLRPFGKHVDHSVFARAGQHGQNAILPERGLEALLASQLAR